MLLAFEAAVLCLYCIHKMTDGDGRSSELGALWRHYALSAASKFRENCLCGAQINLTYLTPDRGQAYCSQLFPLWSKSERRESVCS